jgi:hypothetical protein
MQQETDVWGYDPAKIYGMPEAAPAPLASVPVTQLQAPTQQQVVQVTPELIDQMLMMRLQQMQPQRGTAANGLIDVLKWGLTPICVAGVLMVSMVQANKPNANVQQAMEQQAAIALVAARQKPPQVTCIMFFGQCPDIPAQRPETVPAVLPRDAPATIAPPTQQQSATVWGSHQIASATNFRADPGGPVRFVLPQGSTVLYKGEVRKLKGSDWAKVALEDGRSGWVATDYLASL